MIEPKTEAFSVIAIQTGDLPMHCIGMDVHSRSTMICVLGPDGKTVRERTIRGGLASVVAAVKALSAEFGPVRICYEASTGCGPCR